MGSGWGATRHSLHGVVFKIFVEMPVTARPKSRPAKNSAAPRKPYRHGDLRRVKRVQLAGRALVYGFARLNIDGHFPRWGISEDEAGPTAEAILDLFIGGIARR